MPSSPLMYTRWRTQLFLSLLLLAAMHLITQHHVVLFDVIGFLLLYGTLGGLITIFQFHLLGITGELGIARLIAEVDFPIGIYPFVDLR